MNPSSFVTTILPRVKSKGNNRSGQDEQKEEITDVLDDLERLGINLDDIQVKTWTSRRNRTNYN